jgi:hypothetical protein
MKIGYKVCGIHTHQITKDFKQDKKAAYAYALDIRDSFNDSATIHVYRWIKQAGKWMQYTFAIDHICKGYDGGEPCRI